LRLLRCVRQLEVILPFERIQETFFTIFLKLSLIAKALFDVSKYAGASSPDGVCGIREPQVGQFRVINFPHSAKPACGPRSLIRRNTRGRYCALRELISWSKSRPAVMRRSCHAVITPWRFNNAKCVSSSLRKSSSLCE
jgi:hypothetical protein